jgi:hypothetical protein
MDAVLIAGAGRRLQAPVAVSESDRGLRRAIGGPTPGLPGRGSATNERVLPH